MPDVQLSPTAQKVLQILQQNPGVPYTADDICEQADCSTGQAQIALDAIARAGLAERNEGGSRPTYTLRK